MAKFVFRKKENMTISKPMYFAIGLLVVLFIIWITYYIFLRYSPIMNFKYEGYAIRGKNITENLLGTAQSEKDKNIDLAKIEEQGMIFKKLGTYFAGNKEKTEINLNYPIYINNKNTIYNLTQDITLISKNFEKVAGYPNISITNGKVYNGNNLERTDGKEYIFAKTSEEIYINLKEIKIKTMANEYVLPVNSLIAFEKNAIKYYKVQNDILVFGEIKDIDYNSQVIIKNIENNDLDTNAQNIQDEQNVSNKYSYEELLTRLEIIKNDVEKEEIQKEDSTNNNEPKEEKPTTQENETAPNNQEEQQPENNEQANQNTEYIKPEVTVEDFKAEVYTAKSNLHIKDPAVRIVEAPTFEIYKKGKIYLRRTYTNSGDIIVAGLEPKTEYEIIGKYIYKNEEDKKIENTFYQGKITTKGYEALGVIELSKENGEIYNNKIQIKNVKITSSLQEEALKGLNKVVIVANGIKTTLKNDKANMLLQGKEITVETSEGLPSKSKIDYEIKFFDKNEVELKVENNKGTTRTSKQEPTARITVKEQDIVSVTLDLKLNNKDSVDLENYKYIVTRANGTIAKEEKLAKNEKKIYLNDLDSNQYYEIKIYADYNLDDEKGNRKNNEIGKLVFATKPLSTLGSVEMQVEAKNISTTKVKLTYKIDEERTDKRLIQILNEIKIEIVEKDGEVAKTDTLIGEEIEKLQQGEAKEINYETLKSNTKYEIRITSKVKQGNKPEEIPVTYNYKEFTTLRSTAKVEMQNKFVTGEMIDFDVRIQDKDNAVLNNKIRMELRDEKSNLIDLTEIETNKKYVRKTYNKLEENKTYSLKFYADQYNEGSTDETYKINYLIHEVEIVTEPGISGNIGLKSMLRKTTGKNLVDVESKIKWYSYCMNRYTFYGKKYEKETNILSLYAGTKNNSQLYVYDLKDYIGQEITISFKARTEQEGMKVGIQNSKGMYDERNRTYIDVTQEFKEYKQTLIVKDPGYVGFYVQNKSEDDNTSIYIQDLQIEFGNKKTSYEPYKYGIESEAIVNLEDKRNEIVTNDYYIKTYEDGAEINNIRYEDIPENNKLENAVKELQLQENKNYKIELQVKIRDRNYTIATSEFNTKEGEIKGITTEEEYKEIQPEGNYIVLNNLNFTNKSGSQDYMFSTNIEFEGNINYNGYVITMDAVNKNNTYTNGGLFYKIGENAKISNLYIELYMNNKFSIDGRILFYTNKGTIENCFINLKESSKAKNINFYLVGNYNQGTINNLIVKLSEDLYVEDNGNIIYSNSGTIKNGYLYGKNIKLSSRTETLAESPFVNTNEGFIYNMYSTINLDIEEIKENDTFSKLVANNYGGKVKNVYTVGLGTGYTKKYNANTGKTQGNVENSYYINDEIFEGKADTKTTSKALYNREFQNQILNSENSFEIDKNIEQGYYPMLKLPECMPRQEFIELPELTEKDLPDIVTNKVIEQDNKIAKIELEVYNPAGETITDIKIKNLTTKIVSQNYSNGKSKVVIEVYNPIVCVSNYSILSITTKGAMNLPYTRTYEENERNIKLELYNEIWTIEDWQNMKKNAKENYKLMQDLDFKNAKENLYTQITIYGILDGMGHTIKNINTKLYLFSNAADGAIIRNINIENYSAVSDNYYFGIFSFSQNALLENIHCNNISLKTTKSTQIGGLVGNANQTVLKNITLNNVKIEMQGSKDNLTYIGGVIGLANADLQNVAVNNLYINDTNSGSKNIGGIIGRQSSIKFTVENCYAKGKIVSNSGYIGGIAGNGQTVVKNSYAYVDIIGNGEYIGGIVGNNEQTGREIKNNLYIGNIVNKKETELTKSIIGNSDKTNVNNYIYENNKINGKLVKTEKSLTEKQLKNKDTYIKMLKFDDNFNYENIENGVLPKLNNAERTNLLPNQEDIKIPNNDIFIEEVKTLKTDNNNVQIQLIINNPNEYEINDIQIENMEHTILENRTVNKKTYLKLKGTPTKYYDFYIIKGITYAMGEENITIEAYDIINEAFYKEIAKYEDWQNIDKESYENYRLLTDLDFTGKQDVNNGLRINRLITEGKMHTLKNVTLEAKDKKISLIEESKNLIENINFENITIKSPYSYLGVISNNMGDIQNVNFNNINIEAEENIYLGCIGVNKGKIQNIKLNNINIIGKEKIGGFIGETEDTIIDNIVGQDITVKGKTNSIGGIIGSILANRSTTTKMGTITNIRIENSEITGNGIYAGAIYGAQSGNSRTKENLSSISCKVVGVNHVGGIAGSSAYQTEGIKNVNVTNSQIIGEGENIGGIFGSGGNLSNAYIRNSEIIANNVNSQKIGGMIGQLSWNIFNSGIIRTIVTTNGDQVGGVTGVGSSMIRTYSLDSTVSGKNNVGAITGSSNLGNMQYVYTNSDVTGSGKAVGGFIGYLDNSQMTNISNVTYINNSYYAGGTITGKENVGGAVGEIAKTIYDEDGKQRYYFNYVEANLVSEDKEKVSLGIGNMKEENPKFINNHYYKYSKINGEYPNEKTEPYIPQENYLVEEELNKKETYTNKIKWANNGYYNYQILNENKYPLLQVNNQILDYQEGIEIPTDPTNSINEELEYEFTYQDKKIKTYKTHSEIYDKEGNSVKRKSKIYVKDGKLYLLDSNMPIVPKNFIFDTYNEKEYETVLGTDGKMYDLKESLTYPENFKNEGIKEIGNNLDTDKKEIEVLYKNGDKIKFNYQTGEVIYREKLEENKTNLLDYIGDKLKPKEETIFQNEKDYEETKELMNKLEEMPVEEAKNETIEDSENDNAEGNSSNYVTAYNKEKHKYEIYSEDELLNTSKQTVLTENEKIETNNLANFYSAQISKNVSKKGKTVIYVIICVVIIILVILLKKKRE
ncbi:MAG TPA: hypothetical protein OIM48_00945 [Clostridiaceae bacterium]|nr:hypothetical protein [Clostridiaceae bacterium]